ncbi:hypothetical protein D3C83_15100 [compost metagenome]
MTDRHIGRLLWCGALVLVAAPGWAAEGSRSAALRVEVTVTRSCTVSTADGMAPRNDRSRGVRVACASGVAAPRIVLRPAAVERSATEGRRPARPAAADRDGAVADRIVHIDF